MPKRDYKQVDLSKQKAQLSKVYHEPGYNWITDRFGPPPGIPREEKERLDGLPDSKYLTEVLLKDDPEIEALMTSEEERRRSFRSTWVYDSAAKADDLAKAGFYCLNDGNQVKCAFCALIIAQWHKGVTPMEKHRREASFCSFVRGKAVNNIPFDRIGIGALPKLLEKKDPMEDAKAAGKLDSYNEEAVENQPDRPDLGSPKRREETFKKNWPTNLRDRIPLLVDAGFYNVSGDAACFHCGGRVKDWTPEDVPWEEHAKWYYKCPYLFNYKGGDYIRNVRSMMSEQDRHESENLTYSTTSHEEPQGVAAPAQLKIFMEGEKSGCDVSSVAEAFDSNKQFPTVQSLFRRVSKLDNWNGAEDEEAAEDDEAPEDDEAAENNEAGVNFFKEIPQSEIEDRALYKLTVHKWDYKDQLVREAYKRNRGREFHSPYKLVKMIHKIADEQQDETEKKKTNYQAELDAQRNWMRRYGEPESTEMGT